MSKARSRYWIEGIDIEINEEEPTNKLIYINILKRAGYFPIHRVVKRTHMELVWAHDDYNMIRFKVIGLQVIVANHIQRRQEQYFLPERLLIEYGTWHKSTKNPLNNIKYSYSTKL